MKINLICIETVVLRRCSNYSFNHETGVVGEAKSYRPGYPLALPASQSANDGAIAV